MSEQPGRDLERYLTTFDRIGVTVQMHQWSTPVNLYQPDGSVIEDSNFYKEVLVMGIPVEFIITARGLLQGWLDKRRRQLTVSEVGLGYEGVYEAERILLVSGRGGQFPFDLSLDMVEQGVMFVLEERLKQMMNMKTAWRKY